MSNSVLTQYKTKFTKALDFIVEDLRLSEDEVQELLTWMTKATRSRIFRPTSYAEETTVQQNEQERNNFEAVFIPDLDELDTKPRPKEKKNEVIKPTNGSSKPVVSQSTERGSQQKAKAKAISPAITGGTKPTGSTKPSVPKLSGNNGGGAQKAKAPSKTEKATVKNITSAVTAKTNPIKQVSARQIIKPVKAATKPSKPKN